MKTYMIALLLFIFTACKENNAAKLIEQESRISVKNFTWEFEVPQKIQKKLTGLIIRRGLHQSLKENESHSLGNPRHITQQEAQSWAGPGYSGPGQDKHKVVLEVADLNKMALKSALPGRNLRLLASLSSGGSSVTLSGERAALFGDYWAGHSHVHKPQWKNGELHLMSLYVKDGNTVWEYAVIVVSTDEMAAPAIHPWSERPRADSTKA